MSEADRFTLPETLNLADYALDQRIRDGQGERVAVHTVERSYRYREVQALADRTAAALIAAGLVPEARVVLAIPDGIAFVASFFAVLKAGAVAVMVNPDQAPDQIAAVTAYVRPAMVVVDRGHAAAFAEHGRLRAGGRLMVIDQADGALHLDGAPLPAGDGFVNVATHRDEAAVLLFSGGTTGRPKAVVQSHGAFVNTTELYAKGALGFRADDITLSVPKLYFGYATGSNLLFPFAVGAAAVLFPDKPTPETLFAHIRRFRPSILINVPTLVNRMVAHPDAEAQDLSCLRFATSAGEALPVPLYQRWKETFGVELLDGLGTAEMWHIFITNTLEAVKPGTLGRVVPGFEVRICDVHGTSLADGEVGRLWVRGASRALGYWLSLPQTCAAFHGPWFVGGDLVRRDADGFITYCGRGDDVMKVGGRWLVPQEVESCLMQHPAVEECAVIGVEDADGLTKPYAFVIPRAGAPGDLEATLKAHALAHLEAYKHPRRVVVVDDFPRTHLGKVDRGKLRSTL